ncbi:Uncharacterized protein APZ42_024997 [Daphnia magna]|uniref:Reverse transcriptase domain-containing protein n=1 Tax=Daphnia magna TaxID=35525 RepID=A0A164TJ64_9CRUS|nr:Uncharacterized protein APZ42_024997 [Daphnia magna]
MCGVDLSGARSKRSNWSSSIVLVKKRVGKWRFCIDYRRLNEVKTKYVYPLLRIDDALSKLEGAALLSVVDLQSGYWQVLVVEADKLKTACVTPDGQYQFHVMPFELCSAPITFQRLMDMVLAGLKWTDCLVYMDDVVFFGKDAKEHLKRLGKVLSCFQKANLKLKMDKCAFGNERVRMLGHVVSKDGIEPDPEQCKAIEMFPGKFVPNFIQVAYSLTVMEGKGVFRWGSRKKRFSELKAALVKAAQLAHPDYSKNFEVHPDACDYGIGTALMQERNGHPMLIGFVSRVLNNSERNYTITEKEGLAIVWAVKTFWPYIWGTKIVVKTDHYALCWLMTKQELSGRLERWNLSLKEYDKLARGRRSPVALPYTKKGLGYVVLGGWSRPGEAVASGQASNDQEWLHPVRKPHAEGGLAVPEINQDGYPLCPKLQEFPDPEAGSGEEEAADGDNAGLALLRLSHRMAVPYHRQANGLVERQNKTLATMLAMYMDESHKDWNEFLGFVTFAYNTAWQKSINNTPFMMVYGREAVIPADLLVAMGPSQPKLVGAEDLMKVMMEFSEDTQRSTSARTRRPSVNLSPAVEEGARGSYCINTNQGKKTLVVHVSQMKKFFVESDKESNSDEEVEKLEHADTDTGSEEARTETEEGIACAETDTGETPEAYTGVTPENSTAAAAVEPPARREKGRMRRRPLKPTAIMDEGLQDGKDSAVPVATESPAGRPTRKKRAPGWMKNMLFFTLVCVVGQMVQANEMRGKYVTTEGAVFHPEVSLSLGVFPMPVATRKEESVSHSYAGLAPYLRVSPDRQLFVEFNVDEVRKCAPYMGSVCPFLKPIDRKGWMKSCVAAVFLQEQEGIQRNCHLDSKKWTGINLFYIGGRKWGYAGKDNVTKGSSALGKGSAELAYRNELPTDDASECYERHRRGSCRDAEWSIGTGCRAIATCYKEPHHGGSTSCPKNTYEYRPSGTSSHLKAVERLQRQWEEEENAKRYPFESLIGSLFPLPMLVYLWIEYRRLSIHVDTLLLARLVEVQKPGEEDEGKPGPNAVVLILSFNLD